MVVLRQALSVTVLDALLLLAAAFQMAELPFVVWEEAFQAQ
jgi:hypothetical protein